MSEGRFEQEYYASVYPDYARQNPPRKLQFYRELVERVAPLRAPMRILDIGCAFGAFLSALDVAINRLKRAGFGASTFR